MIYTLKDFNFADIAIDFYFNEENKSFFEFDEFGKEELKEILVGNPEWYYFVFEEGNGDIVHITACKSSLYSKEIEVHTCTAKSHRKQSVTFNDIVIQHLSKLDLPLITEVPVKFRGTINFLTKKLGFKVDGKFTPRNYKGEAVEVLKLVLEV